MATHDAEEILSQLSSLQQSHQLSSLQESPQLSSLQESHQLSIIKISEPISAEPRATDATGNRSSDTEEILSQLSSLQQSHQLSIIKISEPISAEPRATDATGNRSSDASTDDGYGSQCPVSLETDLTHYKELFSKLRFSYLEQVTKEKFLRAIVGDPPLIVEHQENIELERQLAGIKASLKAQKLKVAELVAELEKKGRDLAQ
ncbi:MAG: hypothetical protein M1840_003359, partial [Geoglossum simile]